MFDRTLFTDSHSTQRSSPVFPLPILDGRAPLLLVFDHTELGIEVAYERHPDPGGTLVRSADRATTRYHIPCVTPVLAVSDGQIVDTVEEDGVAGIVVDHGNRWFTDYIGLSKLTIPPTRRRDPAVHVRAGDVLGYLLPSPSRDGPFYPLLFELWRLDHGTYHKIDPLRFMRRWRRVEWKHEHRRHHAA